MNRKSRPMRVLEFLLKQMVPWNDQENLAGDFREVYERFFENSGWIAAQIWYLIQVIKLLPSFTKNNVNWSASMIKNYMKIAMRNIRKYKAYSIINIVGLAIGMACCVLILLYIQDELSYDRYHEHSDRIYRIVDSITVRGGEEHHFALTSAPIGPALKRDFPEVEEVMRLYPRRRMVSTGDKKYYEDDLIYADESLFHVFSLHLIEGSPDTALTSPHSVVISEEIASKYFGTQKALDKTLRIEDEDFLVTGIMQEMSPKSHFFADMIVSMKTVSQDPELQKAYFQNWVRHEFYTYVLLREGYSGMDLQAKLPAFIEKNAAQQIKAVLGGSLVSLVQPLKRIHLHSNLQAEIRPNSDIKYVYIFSVIAFFILLIACVNFMNLATARSANRSKEVGLRKVVGASRFLLIKQFLGESLLFTFFSLLLAAALVISFLPSFNALTGKAIEANQLGSIAVLGFTLFILIFVGIVSGSYPAFFLSRHDPAQVLKRFSRMGGKSPWLRKGLVVGQFGISIILIISTVVVFNQLDYLRNKKLGFDKEHVVLVPIRDNSLRKNAESIKAELQQNPGIGDVTMANAFPGGRAAGDVVRLITEEGDKTYTTQMIYADADYLKTMGIEIIQGRDFSKEMGTDADSAFIVNEAAVQLMQLDDPLRAELEYGYSDDEVGKRGKIIGVARDYQFQSLKAKIAPLVIHIWPYGIRSYAIRIRPANIPATLSFIESKWKVLDPGHPFEYSFMDETFDRIYRSEEKLGQIFGIFSGLAIFIASLGLFGLALFTVEQRTKEIGIRKVLGASAGNILFTVSREFGFLVLLANVVAWPLSYLLMHNWLKGFVYRTGIEPWIFFLAAGTALVIAMMTVGFQALKAAVADPIDSLRYE
ncbi:ABC transporter permease [Acidobacteriota bacterium]